MDATVLLQLKVESVKPLGFFGEGIVIVYCFRFCPR